MSPSGVLSVTSSFQNQVPLLKKHDKTRTSGEPYGCSQCDFEFLKSNALIEMHDKTHTRHEPFRCSQCDFRVFDEKLSF